MKVILTEDLAELGNAGDTVEVKTGYARNYLMPRNLAVPATKGNLQAIDHIKRQKEARDKKRRQGAEKVRDELEKLTLTTQLVTDEDGKVFGSVTTHTIADLIRESGQEVERRTIQLDEAIKALGVYTIKIRVDKDIEANVKLIVEKKTT
jgi:large subunit ribosomal protein L9